MRTCAATSRSIRDFGLDAVVAVNSFRGDTRTDSQPCAGIWPSTRAPLAAERSDGFEHGGRGARRSRRRSSRPRRRARDSRRSTTPEDPLRQKIEAIATRVYGAGAVVFSPRAQAAAEQLTRDGLAGLPVCLAKTPLSLSHDPGLGASPKGFALPITDLRPYTGAGWIVALCGDTMTMPGLGKSPAALGIDVDADGRTVGLF